MTNLHWTEFANISQIHTDRNILTNIVKTQIGIVNKYREWQNKLEEVIEKSFSEKYYKKTNPTIISKLLACKRKAKKYLNGIKILRIGN